HHKAVTSVEFAGRWSLLRNGSPGASLAVPADDGIHPARESAIEDFARVMLRRYGVVFRRLLDRESLAPSCYELSRVYRRLEARGEIRGGYFVSGVSGEQFALADAIGRLRSLRKTATTGEWVTISGADPLNLSGILTPGPRVTAIASNRILLRDGVPVAALEGGQIIRLSPEADELNGMLESTLRIGRLPVALRPYYS